MRPKNCTKLNHQYFEIIDTADKAYWLGFIMADGCVIEPKVGCRQLSIHLSEKDVSHLRKFKKAIATTNNICFSRGSVRLAVSRIYYVIV